MCNTQKNNETTDDPVGKDYRFIDYRLNQLEARIAKGLEKLEIEQNNNNKELMKTLQLMQESNNEQNKQLIKVQQKQYILEEKINKIDVIKDKVTKHNERIHNLERRLGLYQAVVIGVIISVVGAFIVLLIKLIH